MKKILHIISSPRGEASLSVKLGNAIIEKIKVEYPGSTVKENNLATKQLPHLEEATLAAFLPRQKITRPKTGRPLEILTRPLKKLRRPTLL